MDQLSAHLDRGWDLAQRGDPQGAQLSARRAIDLCPDAPEPYNLLGYVAALAGDWEDAVEAYQHAALLDDTYVEAMLGAAELLIHPLGDHDEALALCRQVLDISHFEDEVLDAKLLQFEAFLATGATDKASKVLDSLGPGTYPQAIHNYLAGRAHFEFKNHQRAAELLDAALAAEPDNAEAHYQRGLVHEQQDNRRAACECFMQVRQLELGAGLPSWAPETDIVLQAIQTALDALPTAHQAFLADSQLFVLDMPGHEVIADGVDVYAPILIDTGLRPPLSDSPDSGTADPAAAEIETRVFIYMINMLRAAGSLDDLQQTIQEAFHIELDTVRTELASLNA